MTLRFQFWRWFVRAASVLAIPAVAVWVLEPGRGFEITALVFIAVIGASGAIVALLFFSGLLRFIFTDSDRRSFVYRLLKSSGVDFSDGGADDNAA